MNYNVTIYSKQHRLDIMQHQEGNIYLMPSPFRIDFDFKIDCINFITPSKTLIKSFRVIDAKAHFNVFRDTTTYYYILKEI